MTDREPPVTYRNFRLDVDSDGIALVTWDMPGRSMNVFTAEVMDEIEHIVETLAADDAIRGAVITSGKETFSGGADLAMLQTVLRDYHGARAADEQAAVGRLHDAGRRMSVLWRRLETYGTPFVAALNGTAMGGAFELALACHRRVAALNERARLGLPEVRVGIFPGAGGTQRVARLVPPADALQMMLKGTALTVEQALEMKLIDEAVAPEELLAAARRWILDGGEPVQPWDRDGFRPPGGRVWSPGGMQTFMAANALYRRETFDNYPGARAIVESVFEGLQVPMDTGLRIESRKFTRVLRTREAEAMVRSLFISMQELARGARRPAAVPSADIRKVGVLGAGFMGAGIAYVTARAGMEVVLVDRDVATAETGRAHADRQISKDVARGRASAQDKERLLGLIRATADYAELDGADLVIEAVFEDSAVKTDVIQKAEAHLGPSAVFGSNTSTLPITGLARASARPERFIGIHFFSPVDRMQLVEIIVGRKTGDEALARAFDYCRALRKTPIVVNDSRGFYTSRVVTAYLREGHLMLGEGIPAPMIENAARMAGMPVGPLALTDEVAVDLAWKILQATRKDLGAGAVDPRQEALLEEMVVRRGRLGRKNAMGFYDYPDTGRKRLWPGLVELQPELRDPDTIDVEELKLRLLAIQSLETVRCFSEGVLVDVREADVGSILGFGFAPFTGGTLSHIDGTGAAAFVALCRKLACSHGARFRPNRLLVEMAKRGETFYGRFAPGTGDRQAG
jgi:3-hydroxyacyl-CoA dehydrogenase / enoyl-CoA hydratase / 3-hydroxybutyryl-CoA epimerase